MDTAYGTKTIYEMSFSKIRPLRQNMGLCIIDVVKLVVPSNENHKNSSEENVKSPAEHLHLCLERPRKFNR